jgi:pyruvate-formate lyase-activating enzyme
MNSAYRRKGLLTEKREVPLPEFPRNVLLEPTNACNLRCRMCPAYGEGVDRRREVGYIEKDIWTGVIDEIGSWPSEVNLDIHGAGEPLLHPDFFDMLRRAKGKKNILAGFICNATMLDRERAREVIDIGVDWICFSVDGGEKEVFEYYRRGADFEQVEENIRYLLSLRKKGRPSISFNMVNHKEADTVMFMDRWAGIVDSMIISLKRPVRRDQNLRLRLHGPCPLLYQQLVIGWPGKTVLCCEDYWGDHITGEYPSESLYDIWHGESFSEARRLHEAGDKDVLDLCRTCDFTIFHRFTEKTIEKNGCRTVVREERPEADPALADIASR